ncbi:hypothetical protein NZ698_00290 [Chryseobacterium sp. PBS4-4]|uniref:Lipoprotein n=1 Tax=Chryseobacterium edaphi TaxID=2976532 RepID=A0ABT2W054_9FLAO|nr:hypothetical protein [Chryseobacterium edaphi]MCU7615618.1 hypothetical protein [Chryseobacterium edaphi]
MYRKFIWLFIVFSILLSCKSNFIGKYRDNDWGRYFIDLKKDNSYRYWYSYDTYESFSYGIWEQRKDTLFLTPKILYDTVRLKYKDSLIISIDEKADLIVQKDSIKYNNFLYSIYMSKDMLLHPQRGWSTNTIKLVPKRNGFYLIYDDVKNQKKYFHRLKSKR